MIRAGRFAAAVAALALLLSATAHAESAREKHQGRGAKYAKRVSDPRFRGMCVCQEGSANYGALGNLVQVAIAEVVVVRCNVPLFFSDGDPKGSYTCDTFVPLLR